MVRIKRLARYFRLLENQANRQELNKLAECGQLLNIILFKLEEEKQLCIKALEGLSTPKSSPSVTADSRKATKVDPLSMDLKKLTCTWKGMLVKQNHSKETIDSVTKTPELIPLTYLENLAKKYQLQN